MIKLTPVSFGAVGIDVKEILKISTGTLNDWCAKGLLVVSRVQKRSYFALEDVLAMLEKGKQRRK